MFFQGRPYPWTPKRAGMWYCGIVLFPELFAHPSAGMWYCGIVLFPELFAHPSGGMWAIAFGAEDMPGAGR